MANRCNLAGVAPISERVWRTATLSSPVPVANQRSGDFGKVASDADPSQTWFFGVRVAGHRFGFFHLWIRPLDAALNGETQLRAIPPEFGLASLQAGKQLLEKYPRCDGQSPKGIKHVLREAAIVLGRGASVGEALPEFEALN